MANLKEIRGRITSVSSTMQITSAMKMVSAAKLKKAQDAIIQMRPYAEKLKEILGNLSSSVSTEDSPFSQQRNTGSLLIIPISSNRGLCGAFNSRVIKTTQELIAQNKGKQITILPIGKKIDDYYKKTEYVIKGTMLPSHLNELFDDLSFDKVSVVAKKVMNGFRKKQYDKVIIVYNQFKNAVIQDVVAEQFLPIKPTTVTGSLATMDYLFEPEKEKIMEEIIPKSLKVQFYKALLDSYASEHGARMTAMHKATDNAGELRNHLKLTYNKARQAAITNEILEIVAGAEALG